jgi:ketosteroid isomerase-like protein
MSSTVTLELIDAQEEQFAAAFSAAKLEMVRQLYHPEVVYVSPTTRLFGWPERIEGVDATLDFIQLTIAGCSNIVYKLDERAVLPEGTGAYTRIVFDWDAERARLRSRYVVLYRYVEGRIGLQELYYDPGARPETLGAPTG